MMALRSLFAAGLVMCLIVACSSLGGHKNKGDIAAPQFVDELYGALRRAEARLGRKYSGGTINVHFKNGQVKNHTGEWYGIQTPAGVVGGLTQGKNVLIYLTPDGRFQPYLAELELCHSILPGNDEAHDYKVMRAAGYVW